MGKLGNRRKGNATSENKMHISEHSRGGILGLGELTVVVKMNKLLAMGILKKLGIIVNIMGVIL